MRLHLIIPVVDEIDNLRQLLPYLVGELAGRGIITVADGGSTDGTAEMIGALTTNKVSYLSCKDKGRAQQMNEAAALNTGDYDVLYFMHADTRPPRGFYDDIAFGIKEGYPVGCYRFRFDSRHPMLAINSFFTRFDFTFCRGGDQSLYLTRAVWEEIGGFDGDMKIMEDYDIIHRARRHHSFRIIPRSVVVSARKYINNSWLEVQLANLRIVRMYKRGAEQQEMVETYRRMLRPW